MNLKQFERAKCGVKDKERCVKLIELIVQLSRKARVEGILSLEDELPSIKNPLLAKGIALAVDGVDPSIVKSIIESPLLLTDKTGVEVLSMMIAIEGVMLLMCGENPPIVWLKLLSILGEEYIDRSYDDLPMTIDFSADIDFAAGKPKVVEKTVTAPITPASSEEAVKTYNTAVPTIGFGLEIDNQTLQMISDLDAMSLATVLFCLDEKMVRYTLSFVSDEKLLKVIRLFDTIQSDQNPEKARQQAKQILDRVLDNKLSKIFGIEEERLFQSANLDSFLKNIPASLAENIAEMLNDKNPEIAQRIRRNGYDFTILLRLDARSMQIALQRIESDMWAKSLKNASQDLLEWVFSNLSARTAKQMRDDMALIGDISIKDIEKARDAVIHQIVRLYEQSEIDLN